MAEPCISYPSIFHRGTIFDKFPYLLPNLICTIILICGVAIGILFLEETHELKKNRRDIGLEAGNWILRKMRGSKTAGYKQLKQLDEMTSLASDNDQPPDYRSSDEGFSISKTIVPKVSKYSDLEEETNVVVVVAARSPVNKSAFTAAFTRPVVLNIIGYGILA